MEKDNRLVYEAHRSEQFGHPFLKINLRKQSPASYRTSGWYTEDVIMEMTWQANFDNPKWYGFRVDVNAHTAERLAEAARILGKIEKYISALPDYHSTDEPLLVLDALEKMHAVQVVYDSRESEHVELDKLQPQSKKLWLCQMWPYKGKGLYEYGLGRAICETEQQAKIAILEDAANTIKEHGDSEDGARFQALVLWLNADSPVELSYHADGPEDRRTAREMAGIEKEKENVKEGL